MGRRCRRSQSQLNHNPEEYMLSALQTKLLIVIAVLLAGVSSYLAYETHQRQVEQQKMDQAAQQMRTEGAKEMPSGWAKSLKSK